MVSERLLRVKWLQAWFSMSNESVEDAIYDSFVAPFSGHTGCRVHGRLLGFPNQPSA